jgi:hypothetical protein
MTDHTQHNLQNTKFGSYTVSNYFSNSASNAQVDFATAHTGLMFGNRGLSSGVVDYESALLHNQERERPLERLQLFERPFKSVPYLGRGQGDVTIESMLREGERTWDKKSVATIMDKPFTDIAKYPMNDELRSYIQNPANQVEEMAMDGWVRGGASARELNNASSYKSNARV